MAQIDDELRDLVECGVAIVIGTHDGALVPEIARGWGLQVRPDRATVEVCIGLPSSRRTVENLARDGRIAVTCVRPTNYKQVQFKGSDARVFDPTPEDRERVERHRKAFAWEVDHVGIAADLAPGFWAHDDPQALLKVCFTVEDAYDQTPGPNAGRALSPAPEPNSLRRRRAGGLGGATVAPPSSTEAPLAIPLDRIRACLEGVIPSPFATVSKDGTPNVTYLSIVRMVDAEHVGLSFQFFSKSRRNVEENPRAQVIVVDPGTLRQYRLDLVYRHTESEGALFESMRSQLAAIASQHGMAKVFVLRGVDVYRVLTCDPIGHDASAAPAAAADPLAALDVFGRRIAACADLDALFAGALEAVEAAFGHAHSFLMLKDEGGTRLFTIASRGYPASGVGSEAVIGEGLIGVAAQSRASDRRTNLARDLVFSRAFRDSVQDHPQAAELEREIPLPGLPNVLSQLAVPLVAQDELVGMLCLQSARPGAFLESDARLVEVAARQLASSLALLQAEADRTPEVPARPPDAATPRTGTAVVKHYASDDSIFIDDNYLIKGVAGRVLWKLIRSLVEEGRVEFANKQIRLDASLQLPEIKDNLETRLILLRRRLEERCDFLRIVPTARGRFQLQARKRLALEDLP